jgi:hypothetical protein
MGSSLGFSFSMLYTAAILRKSGSNARFPYDVRQNIVGLFIEGSSMEEIEKQIAGFPITLPRRRTFYGMEEVGVTEAGGHIAIFARLRVRAASGQLVGAP